MFFILKFSSTRAQKYPSTRHSSTGFQLRRYGEQFVSYQDF